MAVIHKIKELLFKDVSKENQLNDLSVLLRFLCVINFVFNAILTLFFAFSLKTPLFRWSLSFVIIFSLILWMTYWEKSSATVYIYTVAMIFSMVAYSFSLGPTAGFQFSLYSLILLYCYKTDDNPASKYLISLIVTIIVISIWIYLTINSTVVGAGMAINSNVVQFTRMQERMILICDTFFLSPTFVTIASFYYLKFSSAEHKLVKYNKKLERLATMDPLTQLTNRRGMMDHLEEFIKESKSSDVWSLSLAISDIDFFKRINDTYGHDAGDYVLCELGKLFNEFMRDKGKIARWGGEEFLFAFENNNGDYAYEQLNKLKYQIEKKTFKYKEFTFYVTMTFGLEEYDDSLGLQKTIEHADSKLYQGKSEGRNRVIY